MGGWGWREAEKNPTGLKRFRGGGTLAPAFTPMVPLLSCEKRIKIE